MMKYGTIVGNLAPVLASVCFGLLILSGCSDTETSTSRQETTVDTPNGETTVTVEKEVEQSGENPPVVNP